MPDSETNAAGRDQTAGDTNRGQASTQCSTRHRGRRLNVAKLREAINNPPMVAGLLDELKRDATGHREELLRDAADAAAEVAELETALAASTSPAERADLAEKLAGALSREVAALEDALAAIGGGE